MGAACEINLAIDQSSKEAYLRLKERGILIVPDFLANPGGIIAAYVELTSDITPEQNLKTRKNVLDAREYTIKKISDNVSEVFNLVQKSGVDMVSASRMLALRNMQVS